MYRRFQLGAVLSCLIGVALADEAVPTRGAEILAPFKAELKEALLAGLAEGPMAAIGACKLEAPRIAAAISIDGVEVGRASHRLRNPGNSPPEWVMPVMREYLADAKAREPRSMDLPGGKVGYVEPILMQPICLTCHGDIQDPALGAQIAEEYPEDQATGFELGELRGVFWATFPEGDQSRE